jgi:hypothetical protein
MLLHHARPFVGGAVSPTNSLFRHISPPWWLLVILAAAFALLFAHPAEGATVSGEVSMPVADGGYQPSLANSKPARVRVEGTAIETSVVATTKYTGTFTLTGVPTGPVTLIYVETPGEDSFTMDSRRLSLDVTDDVAGLQFNLVHHWKNLPAYPPPWLDRASYDIWEPYWVSAKVGFILFLNRAVWPQQSELWRTTNGGTTWTKIGHWSHASGNVHPDITGRSMLFADAYHGVVTAATSVNFGMLRTGDGGTTWQVIDLPETSMPGWPVMNGIATVQNYARIDSTHWIACGPENSGTYMGAGSPVTMTIWETADAGASWARKHGWLENYAGCSAVDADKSGHAILFATPHVWGGGMHRELRDTDGAWSNTADNNIITNSGSGTADVPMVGNVVWVRATEFGASKQGLFQSTDYGATFAKLSDSLPQYMDFASTYKGLAPSGGPMYATYDGGVTWLYQSGGGGICCHGNYVWTFDAMNAVWADGGVGDPNGVADIFMYVEPRKANFELLPGVAALAASASPGDSSVPIIGLRFENNGPMPLKVTTLKLQGSGTGDELLDVSAVKAWWDRDANGVVDGTDPLLASGAYAANDGELTLTLGSKYLMQPRMPFNVLVTYDFSGFVTAAGTFKVAVTPAGVVAQSADVGTALVVNATAPPGTVITSEDSSLTPSTVTLSAVTLKKTVTAGCLSVSGSVTLSEPAPATGVVVYLSDTIGAATTPATISVPAGSITRTFTIKTSPVSAVESGSVLATLGPVTLGQALTVRPMGMLSVTLTPASVVGGGAVSGVAKLECQAGPGPVRIELASTSVAAASPTPSSITLAPGVQSGAFQVVTTPVAVTTKPTIKATANGIMKSKVLTVLPP